MSKKYTLLFSILTFLLVVVGSILFYQYQQTYKEFNFIKSELSKIPNMDIMEMNCDKEDGKCVNIWARIFVKEKGYIFFHNLNRQSFREDGKVCIDRVGDNIVVNVQRKMIKNPETGKDEPQDILGEVCLSKDSIILKEDGIFHFPQVVNIQQAVQQYDQLNEAIMMLPKTENEEFISVEDKVNGVEYNIAQCQAKTPKQDVCFE
jgi:hypothetical protein